MKCPECKSKDISLGVYLFEGWELNQKIDMWERKERQIENYPDEPLLQCKACRFEWELREVEDGYLILDEVERG